MGSFRQETLEGWGQRRAGGGVPGPEVTSGEHQMSTEGGACSGGLCDTGGGGVPRADPGSMLLLPSLEQGWWCSSPGLLEAGPAGSLVSLGFSFSMCFKNLRCHKESS